MSQSVCRLVLAALLVAGVGSGACSSSKSGGPGVDGAGGGGAGGAGGGGTGGTGTGGKGGTGGSGGSGGTGGAGGAQPMDASPAGTPPKDCLGLRNCVHACGTDKACVTKCVSTAPAAAQALYQKIVMCSMQACPSQETACRCEQECQGGGVCADLVDMCNVPDPDVFCDPMGPECGL